MQDKPQNQDRINHIIEAIDKIFRYTENIGFETFLEQDMLQDAVIKNFEVIGEAVYHISKELKEKYPSIEWKKIERLRHILVHDYYKINPQILWNTKEQHIESLKNDLLDILSKEF